MWILKTQGRIPDCLESGKLRRILGTVSLHDPVQRANQVKFSKFDLDGMGNPKLQVLSMATLARQALDITKPTAKRLNKQLFLCTP